MYECMSVRYIQVPCILLTYHTMPAFLLLLLLSRIFAEPLPETCLCASLSTLQLQEDLEYIPCIACLQTDIHISPSATRLRYTVYTSSIYPFIFRTSLPWAPSGQSRVERWRRRPLRVHICLCTYVNPRT